jgi:hypothetical protein
VLKENLVLQRSLVQAPYLARAAEGKVGGAGRRVRHQALLASNVPVSEEAANVK